MADQGKWFKLWLASLDDPDLENLSLEDWARWARLGAFIKKHGKNGKMILKYPARVTQNLLRVDNFESVIYAIKRFPNYQIEESQNGTENVTVESVTYLVTCQNWHKYQGDFSRDRVRRHRANVTANVTPQEEKRSRREKEENNTVPYADFLKSWNDHCSPLPKASRLTGSRKTKIAVRWKEASDLNYWIGAARRLAGSDFASSGGWASFDWLIENDTNHVKATEGKYDNKAKAGEASWMKQ